MCVDFGENISIIFGVIDIYMKKHVKNDWHMTLIGIYYL